MLPGYRRIVRIVSQGGKSLKNQLAADAFFLFPACILRFDPFARLRRSQECERGLQECALHSYERDSSGPRRRSRAMA
jgi:hypothetical protein